MSPDDVFAAQFWPWPDPAIKRDPEGRVLFVNAAFLSMYGGRVEDWRGNAVGGWPAPQPAIQGQASPYRFETRLPDETGVEQIYDWMEQTLADGNAFALARNVTIFTHNPEPDPKEQIPAQEVETVQQAPQQDLVTPPAEYAAAPAMETPPVQTLEQPQEPEREFERRALPIEAESAVLGNNWRDAVIAKAVGAETVAPVAEPTEPEAQAAPQSTGGSEGPIKILLAEDNAINALLTRTLLEAEGHTVETVEDGALAVEAMKGSTFDLIFMDMRMPNMDGLEATRKIRTLPNVSRHLPIIALTANAFDDDRNACFDSGMNDFMTKPVSAEELSEMVREWTGPKAQERLAS